MNIINEYNPPHNAGHTYSYFILSSMYHPFSDTLNNKKKPSYINISNGFCLEPGYANEYKEYTQVSFLFHSLLFSLLLLVFNLSITKTAQIQKYQYLSPNVLLYYNHCMYKI